jgi:hydroxyethylthiazole kinase-like uncharacterized protein yjeF
MPALAASAAILTPASLRAIERAHARDGLMERAGAAAAAWAAELCTAADRPVLVVVGPGNNGGDALVVARLLRQRFFDVRLVLAAEPDRWPTDAKEAWHRLSEVDVSVEAFTPEMTATRFGLVIDGLFGIGLARPVEGEYAALVRCMNESARLSSCPLLALDCPSGLDGETGRVLGEAVCASHTITFIGLKAGLLTAEGPARCGAVRVDALGLDASPSGDDGRTIGSDQFHEALRRRSRDSHKGSFGSAGILGGASGMLGAAILAGRAALHLGAGRVYLGLIDEHAPRYDAGQPELMLRDNEGMFAAPLTALAAGPGLGTAEASKSALAGAIAAPVDLLLDADAINLVASVPDLRGLLSARGNRHPPTILTPHPAEAARLLGCGVDDIQADRIGAAKRISGEFNAWTVLKGAGSVVASPAGAWWINTSGNPALATAGSGDVLSGFIVALLAQGIDAGAAVRCAVHLHGAAADAFAADLAGETGLAASELVPIARRLFNRWIAK